MNSIFVMSTLFLFVFVWAASCARCALNGRQVNADDAVAILAELECSLDSGASAEWTLTEGVMAGASDDLSLSADSDLTYKVALNTRNIPSIKSGGSEHGKI